MGGYYSGRAKKHLRTDECLHIDMQHLKPGLQKGNRTGQLTSDDGQRLAFILQVKEEDGTLTLLYSIKEQRYSIDIPLVTTPCNYGGRRWWIIAPCCGARVRVVYFTSSPYPQCRGCADLHYHSQQASVIDRQVAYEKYLLRNWGYTWAKIEYTKLKAHYFDITPEYREIAARSNYDRQLHLLRALMRFNRVMMNTHVRQLRSIRTQEHRLVFLECIIKEWGIEHALTMFRLSGIQLLPEDEQLEATVQKEVHEIVESGRALVDPLKDYDILTQASIIAMEQEIEYELKHTDLTQKSLYTHLALI